MPGLLTTIARRLGFAGEGAAVAAPDPLAADIDNALARRRAARAGQQDAHDRAWIKRRAEARSRDPIWRDRDIIRGRG